MDPNQGSSSIVTNAGDICGMRSQTSDNIVGKNRKRVPLTDIINVKYDLSKRFDSKYDYLLLYI